MSNTWCLATVTDFSNTLRSNIWYQYLSEKFYVSINLWNKFLTSTMEHLLSDDSNREEKSKLSVEVSKVVIKEPEDMFHAKKYKNSEFLWLINLMYKE